MPIHFWQGLQQGPVLDSFKKIVHEWNVAHSDSPVEIRDFTKYGDPADEGLSKPDEEQPNLILVPEFQTGKLKEALKEKKIVPISEFFKPEELQKIALLVKRTFGDKEGNLSSLPFNPACGVIYTHPELMEKIGRDPNYVPASLEELEAVSKELIEKGLVKQGYTCAWAAAYLVEVPAAQQDLPLVVPDNGKEEYGQYQLSAEWLKGHIFDLRQQKREGVFAYIKDNEEARKAFVNRDVAFFFQGSTHLPLLQQGGHNIGCGPLPTLVRGQKEKYAFPLGGASIYVLNNSTTQKMLEGVRGFLQFLASEEMQERWHKETGYVPVLESLPAKLEEFYKENRLHKAVVQQTIEAPLGKHSFGIHAPNYADARKGIFALLDQVMDLTVSDEDVSRLLEEFDAKFSLPLKN